MCIHVQLNIISYLKLIAEKATGLLQDFLDQHPEYGKTSPLPDIGKAIYIVQHALTISITIRITITKVLLQKSDIIRCATHNSKIYNKHLANIIDNT